MKNMSTKKIRPLILLVSNNIRIQIEKLIKQNENYIQQYLIIQEFYMMDKPTDRDGFISINDFEDENELKQILPRILKYITPTHIVSMEEFTIIGGSILSKELGIYSSYDQNINRFRDKNIMRKYATRSGKVYQPKIYTLASISSDKTNYPVVVKPSNQAASIGVFICNDKHDVIEAIKKHKDYIIEEYIDLQLCHIDVIIKNSKNCFFSVGYYIGEAGYDYAKGNPISSYINPKEDDLYFIEAFIENIINIFNPQDGVLHIEAFYEKGKPLIFLEIGRRPAGGSVSRAIYASSGVDIIEAHFKLNLNLPYELKVRRPKKPTGILIWPKLFSEKIDSEMSINNIYFPTDGWRSNIFYQSMAQRGDSATSSVSYSNYFLDIVFTSDDFKLVLNDINRTKKEFFVDINTNKKLFWIDNSSDILNKSFAEKFKSVAVSEEFLDYRENILITPGNIYSDILNFLTGDLNKILQLIHSLPDRIFNSNEYLWGKELGFSPEAIEALSLFKIRGPLTFYRWDIIQGKNSIKLLELNAGLVQGGLRQQKLQELYDAERNLSNKNWVHPLSSFTRNLKQYAEKYHINTFLILEDDDYLKLEPEPIRAICNGLKYCGIKNINSLAVSQLSEIDLSQKYISIELFSIDEISKKTSRYTAYFNLLSSGTILSGLSPLCECYMSKLTFALLYKGIEKGIFNRGEEMLIKKYIPQTKSMNKKENQEVILNSKDHLILKPALGSSGNGILVGGKMDLLCWQSEIANIIKKEIPYVAQDYVKSCRESVYIYSPKGSLKTYKVPIVYSMYMTEGSFCGGYVRSGKVDDIVVTGTNGGAAGVLRVRYE